MIEAAGASLLYLPPYSPDFNPIENAFAKLKALLRKAAERTVDGLWNAIGRIVDTFSPAECANYFAAAGSAGLRLRHQRGPTGFQVLRLGRRCRGTITERTSRAPPPPSPPSPTTRRS